MNLNEFNLSNADKAYMIVNSHTFPLNIATSIRSNSSNWNLEPGYIELYNSANDDLRKLRDTIYTLNNSKTKEFLNNIINMNTYTDDDVKEMLSLIYVLIKRLYEENDKDMSLVATLIMSQIIPHKLLANNIYGKLNNTLELKATKASILIDLFKALLWNNNATYASSIIKMISILIGYNKDDVLTRKCILAIVMCYAVMNKLDIVSLDNNVKDLLDKDNFIEYIRDNSINLPDSSYEFLDTISKDNYSSNIMMVSNHKEIALSQIIKQFINNCDIDLLMSYVGNYNGLSFNIPESATGYLLSKTNFPVGKIFSKERGMFTIIIADDNHYILFTTPEKPDRCFGIQCDNGIGNDLKLLTIKLPNDRTYHLA